MYCQIYEYLTFEFPLSSQMSQIKHCNLVCPSSETCVETGGTSCKHTECRHPRSLDYAIILGNQNSIGAIVKYECIEGADRNNVTSKSTCRNNGQWSEVSIVCGVDGLDGFTLTLLQMLALISLLCTRKRQTHFITSPDMPVYIYAKLKSFIVSTCPTLLVMAPASLATGSQQ